MQQRPLNCQNHWFLPGSVQHVSPKCRNQEQTRKADDNICRHNLQVLMVQRQGWSVGAATDSKQAPETEH